MAFLGAGGDPPNAGAMTSLGVEPDVHKANDRI